MARRWTNRTPITTASISTPTVTPIRSRPAPSSAAMATPAAATTARVTAAQTNTCPERPSGHGAVGAPASVLTKGVDEGHQGAGRYRIGHGRAGQGDGGQATGGHVDPAGLQQAPLDQGESDVRPKLQHRRRQYPGPSEMGEVLRGAGQLAAPAVHSPQRQRGQTQPAGELDPRPGSPKRAATAGGRGHAEAGSTRIFTCSSGRPSASKAPATPDSPTVPVTIGATSTSPSAMARSAAANSSVE